MRQTNEPPSTFDAELVAGRRRFLDYVLRRVDDRELAEDILQDALLRAVKAAPELRDESRLVPWFYRILRHAIVDAYRRRGVERGRVETLDPNHDVEDVPAEDERELCECFRALIPTLKPEYAELLELVELGDEQPQDAARRLGITRNNLKVRRHRARQALRRSLEETCRACAEHGCLDCTCGR